MFHPLSCFELLNCFISSIKATVGEESSICANIQIIRNSANYTFRLPIFSFLLDKIDTRFELSVTTPLMIGHLQMTIGVPDTLGSSNDKFLTYWEVLTSSLPKACN